MAQRAYGGVSAEQRRAQRREALTTAGLEIIGTEGWAKLTVTGLCARAGLNERYFYESFADREAVLRAVFDAITADLASAILAAVAGAPDDMRAKARAAIGAAVDLLADDPRRTRVLFVEAPGVLTTHGFEAVQGFIGLVLAEGTRFFGKQAVLRVGPLGDFAASFLVGGLAETLLRWSRGELAMTRDQLVDHATDLFVLVAQHVVKPT